MHPRLEELFAYAASTRATFVTTVDRVPPDLMFTRPAEGCWSPAEILEHLAIVEAGIARFLAKLVDEAKARGLPPDTRTDSVLHSLDKFGVAARRGRVTSGERVMQKGAMQPAEALHALESSREALLAVYRGADGLDLTQVRAPHPALGELDLYQWLLFVPQHEMRHMKQMEEAIATQATRSSAPPE
jgi:hypothetical protein